MASKALKASESKASKATTAYKAPKGMKVGMGLTVDKAFKAFKVLREEDSKASKD